jgi:succinoglycan biosynthesis protein ExoA
VPLHCVPGIHRAGEGRKRQDRAMTSNSKAKVPRVSVVVPCRNEARAVRAFLDALLRQDLTGLAVEFLIADGRSTDGTREMLQEFQATHPEFILIDNPERIVSTALNRAIRAARGEIIVRMDVHAEFAPDYIRKCVEVLEQSGADNVGGPTRTEAHGTLARTIATAFHSPFCVGSARWHNPAYEGPVDTIFPGCWRKATLERLGLFDETLVRNQDDELNLRLTLAGGRIWQSRSIICWYHPRSSLSQLARQYFQYGLWKVAVIRKHRRVASLRHLAPGAFVLTHLLLALFCLLAASRPALLRTGAGIWLGLWLLYGAAALASAVHCGRGNGTRVVLLLPFVIAIYHFSYGLGFLIGSAYWPFVKRAPSRMPAYFVELSR